MFLKWRVEKAKRKMEACSDAIEMLEKDPYPEVFNEAVAISMQRLKNELHDLTWKFISLRKKSKLHEPEPTEHVVIRNIDDLIDRIGPITINEDEDFIRIEGLDEASIKALTRINQECECGETLMDRLFGEKVSSMPRQLVERIVEIFNQPESEADVIVDLLEQVQEKTRNLPDPTALEAENELRLPSIPRDTERLYELLYELKVDVRVLEARMEGLMPKEDVTLVDLDQAMRAETAKNDPGLHGDMALLLHRLRDPANHPVSLVEMAEDVANGRCEDPGLVASALDMLVEEFREDIGARRSFETSDKACLEAMDINRGTVC